MAEAAELGAEDGVGAGGGGGEVDVDGLAGDGVLLEAHLGDGEAVDDVLGVEAEVYFAVGGEDEFGGDDVVGGVGVGGVEAEGIAFAGGDELGAGDAEGGVGAGVAEVPGELHAGDFDLEGGEGGSGVAGGGPEALGLMVRKAKRRARAASGRYSMRQRCGGFGAAAGEEADEEDEVGESEEGEGDPEIEEEMVVERGAVGAGVGGEEPRWGEQERRVAGRGASCGREAQRQGYLVCERRSGGR